MQDKYNPKVIIDMATLTGACMVGLGYETAGLFSNSKILVDELLVCLYFFVPFKVVKLLCYRNQLKFLTKVFGTCQYSVSIEMH